MQKKRNRNGVPLTKDEFVDIIQRLKESSELVDKVEELFRNSRENLECDYCNAAGLQISHEGVVVSLLEKLMRDQAENISYFIYELDYGKDYRDGDIADENGVVDMSTPEKLYDYLVEEYFDEIKILADSVNEHVLAVYEPMVEDICSRKNVSEKELENFLDGLISACISHEMVELFKRVGRNFYNQYPKLITDYVLPYKEMYEADIE